jgi:hypothetical protein
MLGQIAGRAGDQPLLMALEDHQSIEPTSAGLLGHMIELSSLCSCGS